MKNPCYNQECIRHFMALGSHISGKKRSRSSADAAHMVPAPASRLAGITLQPGPIDGSETWVISDPELNRRSFFDLFSVVWGEVKCKVSKPRRRFTLYHRAGSSMIRGYHACLCSSQCQAAWITRSPQAEGAIWMLSRSGNHAAQPTRHDEGLDSV